MILIASERGGAKQLAVHLLKEENEHVRVHEVRGFVSTDVTGALKEAYATSLGTKCKNFLFSVSLNPPENEDVSIETFENTLERIEAQTGLTDHPRVIVFHEKQGRRHAHCVWSRIDADTMTAKNLSHYKNKLQSISRELYHEHNWKMPNGLVRGETGNPKNYTLAQWQQCKRMGRNAGELKGMMQDCWAISDSAAAFQNALKERGLVLAKGDRRGHVAVTHEGEVLSIARYVGKKAKEVRQRLGDPETLPSVEQARVQIAQDMRGNFQRHTKQAKSEFQQKADTIETRRLKMVEQQRTERQKQQVGQEERWNQEVCQRSLRLNSGLKGVWQRITGQHKRIQQQNEREAYAALKRDQAQRESLVRTQMQDRRKLQSEIKATREQQFDALSDIRQDQQRYRTMQRDPKTDLSKSFAKAREKLKADIQQHETTVKSPQRITEPIQHKPPTPQTRLERLRNTQLEPNQKPDRGPEFER